MNSFDVVVFASWPRGLYLVQELHEKFQKKVAYIELFQKTLPPFGLFLGEDQKKERTFFESQGFLQEQEGGFALLTSEGLWNLQESPHLKSEEFSGDFLSRLNWLPFLSRNLASSCFEFNNFSPSLLDSLDLFADYYLFSPSLAKKKKFKEQAGWVWKTLPDSSLLEWAEDYFLCNEEKIKAEQLICLWDEDEDSLFLKNPSSSLKPEWKWKQFVFSGDLGEYEGVVPSHFVCIKHLSLPWTHDNLLNVFQGRNHWEIGLRLPARPFSEQENKELMDSILHSLHYFFKGVSFRFVREGAEGFAVYGKEKLNHSRSLPKNFVYKKDVKNFFFKDIPFFNQFDLASHLKGEKHFLKEISSND